MKIETEEIGIGERIVFVFHKSVAIQPYSLFFFLDTEELNRKAAYENTQYNC